MIRPSCRIGFSPRGFLPSSTDYADFPQPGLTGGTTYEDRPSMVSDCRISVSKLIRREAHETDGRGESGRVLWHLPWALPLVSIYGAEPVPGMQDPVTVGLLQTQPQELVVNARFETGSGQTLPDGWSGWKPQWEQAACPVRGADGGLLVESGGDPYAVDGVTQEIRGILASNAGRLGIFWAEVDLNKRVCLD